MRSLQIRNGTGVYINTPAGAWLSFSTSRYTRVVPNGFPYTYQFQVASSIGVRNVAFRSATTWGASSLVATIGINGIIANEKRAILSDPGNPKWNPWPKPDHRGNARLLSFLTPADNPT